jgi:pimeloyl-ACP methyl ester carboxylesterase
VIVAERRGYGRRARLAPPASVEEHVEDVFAELDARGIERAVLAGMSGGATVALAAALQRPERVVRAVAHEPAVGSVSPELLEVIRAGLASGGRGLIRALAGERTWSTLPPALVTSLDASAALIEADASAFVHFEPAIPPAAERPRVPLVCTIGERSSEVRFDVARRLAERTGAPVHVVLGCGHLPQFDAPEAFADLILHYRVVPERSRS